MELELELLRTRAELQRVRELVLGMVQAVSGAPLPYDTTMTEARDTFVRCWGHRCDVASLNRWRP